jgi:hypothetical protein
MNNQIVAIDERDRAWLEGLPEAVRNVTAQLAHRAARAGVTSPEQVLVGLCVALGERLNSYWHDDLARERTRAIVDAAAADVPGVLRYAGWCIAWEQLPPEERAERKTARSRQYQQQAMASKAASPAQREYLAALGYRGEPPQTMARASELIDQLRRGW